MSKFKTLRTQFEDDYGLIQFNFVDEVYLATSSTPILFGIESSEESLAEFFSKFRIEGEDRNFDWNKDIPEEWKLVTVEISEVEEIKPLNIVSDYIKDMEDGIVSDYVKNMEQWEEMSESEQAIIKSIVEVEKIEPISTNSSFHIYEERYVVDGDTFRFISAISDTTGECEIEKLKK